MRSWAASSGVSEKVPSTYASPAPGRTIPRRALPPRSRSRACASSVLPAPVSPVTTLSPGARASSARSSRSRFSTRSSSSMGDVLPAASDRPGWAGLGLRPPAAPSGDSGQAGQAPELLPQAAVEARPRNLREVALTIGEAGLDVLARRQHAHGTAIDGDVDLLLTRAVADDEDVLGRHHQGACGEGVRRDE